MKVIFMGTPDFATGALEALIEAGHEVLAVVTQPDKPKGRKAILTPPPVKEVAMAHSLTVLQPKRARDPEFVELLKSYGADVFVVAAYGQILNKAILDIPRYGCINIHGSLLPKYRGAAPIQWSILDGEKETGVTLMRMDEGLDTGDMIEKVIVPITSETTGGSLFDELSAAGAKLLVETLPKIAAGEVTYTPQPAESTTPYAAMMSKAIGKIDWNWPAEKIECYIRGLNPWPTAYTTYNNKQLKLWAGRALKEQSDLAPGCVTAVSKDSFCVQTGEGILEVTELQLEGKKRMKAGDFLRGNALKPGSSFTE